MTNKIILVMFLAVGLFGIFVVIKGVSKQKNEVKEIHRLLDKLKSVQNETLEMLDKRAIR